MKDIKGPLKRLYYGIISGKDILCYEGGAVPDGVTSPYAIIQEITSGESSDKTNFGHSVEVFLDLITKVKEQGIYSSEETDIMAGKIFESINSKTKLSLPDGLQIVNTKLIQDQTLNSRSDTHRIYRRVIKFRHLIKEV